MIDQAKLSQIVTCVKTLSRQAQRHHSVSASPPANHVFNFSSAFPRCEILFCSYSQLRDKFLDVQPPTFSFLSISAYVCPSYSKQGSQPVAHQVSGWFSMLPTTPDLWTEDYQFSYQSCSDPSPARACHLFVLGTGLVPGLDLRNRRKCRLR